jgi:DNA-binding NtrC family response regulator
MNSAGFEQLKAAAQRRGQPFNVLIVDDERYVREVFRDYCKITKVVAVEMATDGRSALDRIRHEKYDLITLDLIMPEMSGIDALIAIKDVCPHVPVMIVTGNATEKLIDEAGVLGACKVMYKPVLLEEFIDTVAETLIKRDKADAASTEGKP